MKRFIIWLVPIILLLAAIPFLLIYNVSSLAKIFGVLVVVLTTLAIRYWMFRSRVAKSSADSVKLTTNERFFLRQHIPYYNRMGVQIKKTFERDVCRILTEVSFDNYDRTEVSKDSCLAFASIISLINITADIALWKGTIVVFWEKEEAETAVQESSEVIFLNESTIINALKQYQLPESELILPAAYQALLVKQGV